MRTKEELEARIVKIQERIASHPDMPAERLAKKQARMAKIQEKIDSMQ